MPSQQSNKPTKMNSTTKALAALFGLVCTHLVCHAQVTYDAASQFSPTNNPAAVWSYGYSGSIGNFIKLPTNMVASSQLSGWAKSAFPDWAPAVCKNMTGQKLSESGNVYQIGQLAFHPGNTAADRYGIVRFTAPTNGLYTLTAQCSGCYGAGTSSDVHVWVNGASFFDAVVVGFGSEVSFTSPFAITLRLGDTVDFVVGNGGNGYFGDWTALAATVNLVRPGVELTIYPAVELGWYAEAGKTYQIQAASTLLTNEWVNVGTPVPGEDAVKYFFDSTRQKPKKFYRVVLVP